MKYEDCIMRTIFKMESCEPGKPCYACCPKDRNILKADPFPTPIPGEPEPGIQAGMFGTDKITRPAGRGTVVQIKLDDLLKLDSWK